MKAYLNNYTATRISKHLWCCIHTIHNCQQDVQMAAPYILISLHTLLCEILCGMVLFPIPFLGDEYNSVTFAWVLNCFEFKVHSLSRSLVRPLTYVVGYNESNCIKSKWTENVRSISDGSTDFEMMEQKLSDSADTYGRKIDSKSDRECDFVLLCCAVLCESIGRWHSNCYSYELIRDDHFNVLYMIVWVCVFVCEWPFDWQKANPIQCMAFPRRHIQKYTENQFYGNSSGIDLTMSGVYCGNREMWWSHFDCTPI